MSIEGTKSPEANASEPPTHSSSASQILRPTIFGQPLLRIRQISGANPFRRRFAAVLFKSEVSQVIPTGRTAIFCGQDAPQPQYGATFLFFYFCRSSTVFPHCRWESPRKFIIHYLCIFLSTISAFEKLKCPNCILQVGHSNNQNKYSAYLSRLRRCSRKNAGISISESDSS